MAAPVNGQHQAFGQNFDSFDGTISQFRDWRQKQLAKHAGHSDQQRKTDGPALLGVLQGEAFRSTRQINAETLRQRGDDGFMWLLEQLDSLFGWQPETFLFEALQGYFSFALKPGDATSSIIARYKACSQVFKDVLQ